MSNWIKVDDLNNYKDVAENKKHVLIRYYKSGKSYRTKHSKIYVITEGYYDPLTVRVYTRNDGSTYSVEMSGHWNDALGRLIQDTKAKKSVSIVSHFMELPEFKEEKNNVKTN
jgi:hypothetical protein